MSDKTPLNIMLEETEEFVVKGAKYYIRPLYLCEVAEFSKDGLSVGPQFVNLVDEARTKIVDKWIQRTVTDKDGNAMSLEKLKNWTVKDLRKFMQKVIDISG
jgi:hypothetical protein